MDYKKEFIKRITFLLENDMYIIEPMDKTNLLNLYLYLENNNNKLLRDLEIFLLGDQKMEDSSIYNDVIKRQQNNDFLLKLNDNSYDKMDYFTILSLVRKFIVREKYIKFQEEKLKALDEYFRVVRYQNNRYVYISGAILEPVDIRNHIDIKSGVISNGVMGESNINISMIVNSNFMKYLSNLDNHNDNYSILNEEEKQKIYLKIHPEIPCDMMEKCVESDLFFSDNYCNNDFYLKEDEIFYYRNNYYMMCPNCYNIVKIDSNKIPVEVKKRIVINTKKDPYFYRNVFYKREYLLHEKKKILIK